MPDCMGYAPDMLETTPNVESCPGRARRFAMRWRTRLGPLAWGTLVVFMIQRGTDIANLVCKIFLGRVLPPLDFGAVEPILATASILAIPPAIINTAAVKSISRLRSQGHLAQCRALIHDLQIVAAIGSALSIAVVVALRHFILSRLHLESPVYIGMIAIMLASAWWMPLIGSILRAEHNYRLLSISDIAGPFVNIGLTFLLTGALSLGLQGAIAARVASGCIMIVLLLRLIRSGHRGTREPYPEERAAMIRMLLPMGVLIATGAVALSFDRLFVRNFMVEHSAGISAIFMLGQIPSLIIAPLSFVIFPIAAARHASGETLTRLLLRAGLIGLAVTATCCLAFAWAATPILRIWRPDFAPYGQYVWIYALMTGLQSIGTIVAQLQIARHEYRFLWFYTPPILLACAAVYLIQDHTAIAINLPRLLWGLVAGQALALAGIATHIVLTCRKRRSA